MARPRIFVSSTYYDLKHLRSSLENFIESLGYEPILSEKGDIAYMPDAPLDESCYREVRTADVYVLIIGGRYGSERSGKTSSKAFFDRYDSITKEEYKSAAGQDIPIYVLIERSVYADYENFLRNKDNAVFKYAHVDSVNIFFLIEEILAKPRNNPMLQFDRYSDIEVWLREQWAGMYKELLSRRSNQRQLESLSAQVTQLAEFNQTLKRYLEEVMVKVAPQESAKIIQSESTRLVEVSKLAELAENPMMRVLVRHTRLPIEEIGRILRESPTLEHFVREIRAAAPSDTTFVDTLLKENLEPATRDFRRGRELLGLASTKQATDTENGQGAVADSATAPKSSLPSKKRRGTRNSAKVG